MRRICMNGRRFFAVVLPVFLSIIATSCLASVDLKSIDRNTPIQIGGFGMAITSSDVYWKKFLETFGDGKTLYPERVTSFALDLIEKNYNRYVQAAAQEGFILDVDRFKKEFLDPKNPPVIEITALPMGMGYAIAIRSDPQDNLVASCPIEIAFDLKTGEFVFVKGGLALIQQDFETKNAAMSWIKKSI